MTTTRTTSFLARPSLGLLLLAAAAHAQSARSQTPAPQPPPASSPAQPPLRFEVASIRAHPSAGDLPSDRRILPGGRFVATSTTVRTLIRVALLTDDSRISGAPGWIDQPFDINATTVDHAEITTPEQLQQVLLSLLQERFQFAFHREQKEGPVYWLELNKPGVLGPALKPATSGSRPAMSNSGNGGKITAAVTNSSMSDIAAMLQRQAGRPVEDHTGLDGKFSFQVEWASPQAVDSSLPSLFTVLKEQLGLKLRPAKGTHELIVIDRIAQPSSN